MPDETPRLTRSTELVKAEAQALLISDALARARALSNIMNEYRRSRNDAKVIELSGLIRVALGESTEPDALRLLDDALLQAASVLDSSTDEGQAAWKAYLDHFSERNAQDQYTAYYNAARMLPAE